MRNAALHNSVISNICLLCLILKSFIPINKIKSESTRFGSENLGKLRLGDVFAGLEFILWGVLRGIVKLYTTYIENKKYTMMRKF